MYVKGLFVDMKLKVIINLYYNFICDFNKWKETCKVTKRLVTKHTLIFYPAWVVGGNIYIY